MKLENDFACGITTGGKENCEWDCSPDYIGFVYWRDPSCLTDCFPKGHCASKVLDDFKNAGGICGGSSFLPPGTFVGNGHSIPNTTKINCEYQTVPTPTGGTLSITTKGIFSEDTLLSLLDNESCIYDVHRKNPRVWNTITILVQTSSNPQVLFQWLYFSARHIRGLSETDILSQLSSIGQLSIGGLPLPFSARLLPGLR